jgi:WD40 repeat protein
MLRRETYTFVGVVGLLLFTTALSSSSTPRPDVGLQQRRDERKATVPVRAEPPARDPALRLQLEGHEAEIKALALVPHSNRLVTLDCDSDLRYWNLKSGTEEYKTDLKHASPGTHHISKNQPSYCSALSVSPDGRLVAVCGSEDSGGVVEIYDVRQKKKVREIKPTDLFHGATALSFSAQGDRLAVAVHIFGALQWSLDEAKSLTPAKSAALPLDRKGEKMARAVTHLRGDDVLAVGFARQEVHFYHARSGAELERFPRQPDRSSSAFYQLTLSSDGGLLLGVDRQWGADSKPGEMIHVWDMTTGKKVWTFTHKEWHVTQAALSPDGRYVAVGFYNDPAVRLYRLADGKEMAAFHGHSKGVTCVAFSADGKVIASGSMDKTAIVWDVKDGLLPAAERPKADKDFAPRWEALRDGKPLEALEAVASLAAAKDDGVANLEGKLTPVRKPDAARVQKLIAQLNDDDQPKRDEASRQLAALGTQVEAAVKKALESKPSPDAEPKRRLEELLKDMRGLWVGNRDTVPAVRGVYVLERVGSERAVKLLKKLAEGDPAARLTREAKISLERIVVRQPPKDK